MRPPVHVVYKIRRRYFEGGAFRSNYPQETSLLLRKDMLPPCTAHYHGFSTGMTHEQRMVCGWCRRYW